jgi:hypothetical protein
VRCCLRKSTKKASLRDKPAEKEEDMLRAELVSYQSAVYSFGKRPHV